MKSKYRKAAEMIFKNDVHFCCNALNDLKIYHNEFYVWFYDPHSEFFTATVWFGIHNCEENQLARQLALLFMEQIERTET